MKHLKALHLLLLPALSCTALPSCSSLAGLLRTGPGIIHALADQEQLASPLSAGAAPIMTDLTFSRGSFSLAENQKTKLQEALAHWKNSKRPLLIAGFSSSSAVPEYGRVLSQRRAEAVRTALIELGFDAGALHTTGYGSDITALNPGDVVRIYEARQRPAPTSLEPPPDAAPPTT